MIQTTPTKKSFDWVLLPVCSMHTPSLQYTLTIPRPEDKPTKIGKHAKLDRNKEKGRDREQICLSTAMNINLENAAKHACWNNICKKSIVRSHLANERECGHFDLRSDDQSSAAGEMCWYHKIWSNVTKIDK